MRQFILDLRPDSPPDFTNFLPGRNGEALAALHSQISGALGEPLLYLWGEAGVGKSHLLRAWAGALAAPVYAGTGFLPEPPVAALAVDDVGALTADDQVRLFNLINSARELGNLLLVSGDRPAAQLELRPDLATRLAQGLGFRLLPLADIDKAAALAIRAEGRGMQLSEEVIRYLLTHTRRDLPHLLSLVDGLDTLSLSRKRPPSLPLLKELLQQTLLP